MDPPPIPSVLMRGEWSLGKVLEVYWKYSMIGDTYLGRCLAGFNPDEPGFGALPPHFRVGMENALVMEGMRLSFGRIIDGFGGTGIEGALLLFLASIVYHADTFLLPHIANNRNHPFLSIPLLSQPELLKQLREHVTLEPAGDVMQATGVPRSVHMMDEVRNVYRVIQGFISEIHDLKATLPGRVKNAIQEKGTESGQVTATFVMDRLNEAFENATGKWEATITAAVQQAASSWGLHPSTCAGEEVSCSRAAAGSRVARGTTLYKSYTYKDPNARGRRVYQTDWDVPADFDFPTADLYVAWTAWLLGYPSNQSKKADGVTYPAPVRPLRLLRHHAGQLPALVKKKFDKAWRPILELMDAEVAVAITKQPVEEIDHAFIKATYNHALTNISLNNPEIASALNATRLKISTCCKALKSSVAKKRKASQM